MDSINDSSHTLHGIFCKHRRDFEDSMRGICFQFSQRMVDVLFCFSRNPVSTTALS